MRHPLVGEVIVLVRIVATEITLADLHDLLHRRGRVRIVGQGRKGECEKCEKSGMSAHLLFSGAKLICAMVCCWHELDFELNGHFNQKMAERTCPRETKRPPKIDELASHLPLRSPFPVL